VRLHSSLFPADQNQHQGNFGFASMEPGFTMPGTGRIKVPGKATIIVGAGAAGLAAARDLSRAGGEVVVLEARDRIGGRIFTFTDAKASVPIELGAEFVHGKSPALRQIAQAANLKLDEVSERHWYFDEGKISRSHNFWQQIERLTDRMKTAPSDQSLSEFLNGLPGDDDTRQSGDMLMRYVEGFHAADVERVGIHGLIAASDAADSIDGDTAFRFERGYHALMEALQSEAESYGTIFQLNTLVKEIDWSTESVTMRCQPTGLRDKESVIKFSAEAVIVTVPLSLLQTDPAKGGIHFNPDLPVAKQVAINRLAMGNVLKINLLFRERFWEKVTLWDERANRVSFDDAGFFHYPDAPVPTWWTQMPLRAPLLVGWVGGPGADRLRNASGSEQRIVDQAIASLAQIFNLTAEAVRAQMEAPFIHDWHDDPFARGAYTYVPVNALEAQHALALPVENKLFFAGEATSVGHVGTVHGAIQSGQRAAAEVLRAV
jgi:monoamine oxidase